jgi:F-type H+-transporting ATPase subunit delta
MSKVPRHEIADVIAKQSLQNVPSEQLAREIAAYLISQHRISELDSLVRDILQYRADHGIVEVTATSSHALNDEIRKNIRADIQELYPSAEQIIINEELDESIMGGIRLSLANQQFDASIRSKLNHFKQLTVAGKE